MITSTVRKIRFVSDPRSTQYNDRSLHTNIHTNLHTAKVYVGTAKMYSFARNNLLKYCLNDAIRIENDNIISVRVYDFIPDTEQFGPFCIKLYPIGCSFCI